MSAAGGPLPQRPPCRRPASLLSCLGMPKRPATPPEPPQPAPLPRWAICYTGVNARLLLGEIEAADEGDAIEKAAEQLRLAAAKLIATRRA